MTSKRKKTEQEKRKKRGREKAKSTSQDWCVTFKHQNCLKILLSVHAQTLEADSLHLKQKAVKCTTYKQPLCSCLYGQAVTRNKLN